MSTPNRAPPPVSPELVKWLQETFSCTLPTGSATPHSKYVYMSGQRSVIQRLEKALEEQEKDRLNAKTI